MLKNIHVENYKSIEKLDLSLGRINVFIGENGAGKSNLLEAIALAGAAEAGKLDNEFLASRGIRVSGPELMRSAFTAGKASEPIKVSIQLTDGSKLNYQLTNDNQPYSTWENSTVFEDLSSKKVVNLLVEQLTRLAKKNATENELKWALEDLLYNQPKKPASANKESFPSIVTKKSPSSSRERKFHLSFSFPEKIRQKTDKGGIENFIIYAPENSALRMFEREGQIEPLGINGEGLLKLLGVLSTASDKAAIETIKESLKLFSWFDNLKFHKGKARDRVEIFDRFLNKAKSSFDQRSANEGFLFLAFYLALFTSNLTPSFFAIDNIDSSLNPKLCEVLMRRLAGLAKEHDKQVLFTTHNPAILDGLDLGDPETRLFIVLRGPDGQTRARRFEMKPSTEKPRRLSEMFLIGALGGLPKGS